QRRRPVEGDALEELLRALVDEAEAGLEIYDRRALDAEAEVARLDDPRVHGAHGDLEDALAVDPLERKRLARVDEVRPRYDVAAQRVVPLRPVLMEGETPEIRVTLRDQAEQVVDLALETAGRERARGEGREAGHRRRDRDEYRDRRRQLRRREDVDESEVAPGGARVRHREELAPHAQRRQTVGERRNLPGGQPALDHAGGRRRDARGTGPDDAAPQRVDRHRRGRHLRAP